MTQRFKARIYKLGINPCVDVPKRVSDAFKKLGYIPVKGKLERVDIRATLCPKGNGRHRLYVNGDMRKRAVVDTGNTVSISVSFDSTSKETPRS